MWRSKGILSQMKLKLKETKLDIKERDTHGILGADSRRFQLASKNTEVPFGYAPMSTMTIGISARGGIAGAKLVGRINTSRLYVANAPVISPSRPQEDVNCIISRNEDMCYRTRGRPE